MTSRLLSLLPALLLVGMLSACATEPTSSADRAEFESVNDPLEPMNRVVFDFNQFLDRILLKPLAKGYRSVVPDFAQDVVHNILQNAGEPVTFMNAALQGRTKDAGTSFNRFLVNTIAGGGGIADLASANGLPPVNADFGQTLHVWGSPEGPYLVLPLLGPSNPRDAVGFAVDSVAEPWPYVIQDQRGNVARNIYMGTSFTANALDRRSRALDALDALEKGSIDFYAQLRSVTRQYRHKQLGIKDGYGADIGDTNTEGSAAEGSQPLSH